MQYSIQLPFQLTQHLGKIFFIKNMTVQRHIALIPVVFSIMSLIYFLTTSAKVPIHLTQTTPTFYLKIMVEINPHKCIPKPVIHRQKCC